MADIWQLIGRGIAGPPPFVVVDQSRVNLEDLVHAYQRPGAIIRCDGPPEECMRWGASLEDIPIDALFPKPRLEGAEVE